MNKFIIGAIVVSTIGLVGCGDDGDDGINGVNGTNGADGMNGANGTDGTNGANGADGANGLNSLIVQTNLELGDANCPAGGLQVDSGLDTDGSGALDASEVNSTEFVCAQGRTDLGVADVINNLNNQWYIESSANVDDAEAFIDDAITESGEAKNIILFIGDGMGISTVTAARILDGQNKGMMGEENILSFGHFPAVGLAKTYNVNAQTPDSAGTMTAMMSGVKTDVGVIGVDEDIVRGDCSTVAGNELVTALELAELAGKSTGVIATARLTHATPAAAYAKSADRNWEDISDMDPADHIANGGDCIDIALQLIEFEANLEARFPTADVDGIEVAFGGGRRHFLPNDIAFNSGDQDSTVEGDRTDGRDLADEWQALYPAGDYVIDQTGFDLINPEFTERAFGLFSESHMRYEADRGNDILGEPSIVEMTEKAIDILDNNAEGFFLMVESGRIDHAHHAGNAAGALTDTIAFAAAIEAAVEATDPEDTLIIVTADHGHVFTIAGYPKRGNPILGKVVAVDETDPELAGDGLPYTTLGYMNGLGFRDGGAETDSDSAYIDGLNQVIGRQDLTMVDTQAPGYHQETLVPLGSETHSGEDIGIYAQGPGAQLVSGTNEQNIIFHVMNHAGDLVDLADSAL